MATEAWTNVLSELRYDRGILLGSERFKDMTGVEQVEVLSKIDDAVLTCENYLKRYDTQRWKSLRGPMFWKRFRHRKIERMSDEDVGVA